MECFHASWFTTEETFTLVITSFCWSSSFWWTFSLIIKTCLTLILYSFCALSNFVLLNCNLHDLCHFALLEISAVSTLSSLSILLSCNVLGSRFKNFIKFSAKDIFPIPTSFLFDCPGQTKLSVELMSWQITHKFQSVSRCCFGCKLGGEATSTLWNVLVILLSLIHLPKVYVTWEKDYSIKPTYFIFLQLISKTKTDNFKIMKYQDCNML